MSLAQFLCHLIAMLILTGVETFAVLLGAFWLHDWWAGR